MKTFIVLGVLLVLYVLLTLPKNSSRKSRPGMGKESQTTSANISESTVRAETSHSANVETLRSVPRCPKCGSQMEIKTARRGAFAGNTFWSCSQFPRCRGLIDRSESKNQNT